MNVKKEKQEEEGRVGYGGSWGDGRCGCLGDGSHVPGRLVVPSNQT